jgi:hypothetical protein
MMLNGQTQCPNCESVLSEMVKMMDFVKDMNKKNEDDKKEMYNKFEDDKKEMYDKFEAMNKKNEDDKREMKNEFNAVNNELIAKVKVLEKECLYPKLENAAIQFLNFRRRIDVINSKDNEGTLLLGKLSMTAKQFKLKYEELRKSRNEETHPQSETILEEYVKNSLEIIEGFNFDNVDIESSLYFSKVIIENPDTVIEYLSNYH